MLLILLLPAALLTAVLSTEEEYHDASLYEEMLPEEYYIGLLNKDDELDSDDDVDESQDLDDEAFSLELDYDDTEISTGSTRADEEMEIGGNTNTFESITISTNTARSTIEDEEMHTASLVDLNAFERDSKEVVTDPFDRNHVSTEPSGTTDTTIELNQNDIPANGKETESSGDISKEEHTQTNEIKKENHMNLDDNYISDILLTNSIIRFKSSSEEMNNTSTVQISTGNSNEVYDPKVYYMDEYNEERDSDLEALKPTDNPLQKFKEEKERTNLTFLAQTINYTFPQLLQRHKSQELINENKNEIKEMIFDDSGNNQDIPTSDDSADDNVNDNNTEFPEITQEDKSTEENTTEGKESTAKKDDIMNDVDNGEPNLYHNLSKEDLDLVGDTNGGVSKESPLDPADNADEGSLNSSGGGSYEDDGSLDLSENDTDDKLDEDDGSLGLDDYLEEDDGSLDMYTDSDEEEAEELTSDELKYTRAPPPTFKTSSTLEIKRISNWSIVDAMDASTDKYHITTPNYTVVVQVLEESSSNEDDSHSYEYESEGYEESEEDDSEGYEESEDENSEGYEDSEETGPEDKHPRKKQLEDPLFNLFKQRFILEFLKEGRKISKDRFDDIVKNVPQKYRRKLKKVRDKVSRFEFQVNKEEKPTLEKPEVEEYMYLMYPDYHYGYDWNMGPGYLV